MRANKIKLNRIEISLQSQPIKWSEFGAQVHAWANDVCVNLHFSFLLKIRITFIEQFLIHFHKQLERIVDQTVDGFVPVSL